MRSRVSPEEYEEFVGGKPADVFAGVCMQHCPNEGGFPSPAYILEKGLLCVYCIGEPLPLREKGLEALMAEAIIPQLQVLVPLLKGLEDKSRLVIAYEPVWAIGTGVTASPEQAQETHKAIRDWIAANVDAKTADEVRIQYGGSANAKNAPELSACPDIDGFLVGGASLKPEIMDVIKAIAV